uniref:Uncharacterized protein n=1 Tax=Chromera velia CCMP2878 TaxID=1169474 RepID=A0A0G4HNW8_9ALVE|eukprot:Cvel_29697.t1-p1 / transcript=Cvel_29697.t1 / gene=Cvel_29697 / organism=Chromera_velia_CCMP2878 / gene_product=hypothetical protein / transcript_product=hypothetical protein / location=Cvel_scaffold4113:6488-7684(-) / protein_length=399 / sequence_SO=supercontig / SO=protein_coding / is_pseudo=false
MELFDNPDICGYDKRRSAQDIPHWSTPLVSCGDATDEAIKEAINMATQIAGRILQRVSPEFFFVTRPHIAPHLRGSSKPGQRNVCKLYSEKDTLSERIRLVAEKVDWLEMLKLPDKTELDVLASELAKETIEEEKEEGGVTEPGVSNVDAACADFERLHTFWQNRGKDEELNAEPDMAQGFDSSEVSHTVGPDGHHIFRDKFFRILIEDSSSKLRPIAAVLKEEMTALEKENPIVDALEAKGLRLNHEQAKGKRAADDAGNIIKEKGWVWLHTMRKLKGSKEQVEYYKFAQVQAVFSASGRQFTGLVARDPKHKDWTAQCLYAPMFERNAETATFGLMIEDNDRTRFRNIFRVAKVSEFQKMRKVKMKMPAGNQGWVGGWAEVPIRVVEILEEGNAKIM